MLTKVLRRKKNFETKSKKFCGFFLRPTKLVFRALQELYKDPYIDKSFAPQEKFCNEKQKILWIFS